MNLNLASPEELEKSLIKGIGGAVVGIAAAELVQHVGFGHFPASLFGMAAAGYFNAQVNEWYREASPQMPLSVPTPKMDLDVEIERDERSFLEQWFAHPPEVLPALGEVAYAHGKHRATLELIDVDLPKLNEAFDTIKTGIAKMWQPSQETPHLSSHLPTVKIPNSGEAISDESIPDAQEPALGRKTPQPQQVEKPLDEVHFVQREFTALKEGLKEIIDAVAEKVKDTFDHGALQDIVQDVLHDAADAYQQLRGIGQRVDEAWNGALALIQQNFQHKIESLAREQAQVQPVVVMVLPYVAWQAAFLIGTFVTAYVARQEVNKYLQKTSRGGKLPTSYMDLPPPESKWQDKGLTTAPSLDNQERFPALELEHEQPETFLPDEDATKPKILGTPEHQFDWRDLILNLDPFTEQFLKGELQKEYHPLFVERMKKAAQAEYAGEQDLILRGYEILPSKLPGNKGLDHVAVKYGSDGQVIEIIIGESKYAHDGKARLGRNKDMVQMDDRWIEKKIAEMRASNDTKIRQVGEMLRENKHLIKREANVLDRSGANVWDKLKLPDSKEFK